MDLRALRTSRRTCLALGALLLITSCRRASPRGSATSTPDDAAPSGDAEPSSRAPALGAAIDAYVAGFGAAWGDAHAVHGVVAVARDGEIVVGKTYGLEGGLDTRFAIASVTKPLTAACVFALIDAGKLTLASPARAYVPELAPGITVEHLLGHRSGLPSYTDDPDLMRARGAAHAPAEIARRVAKLPLAFPPGSRFAYSNSNYYVLGLVIEKVTGKTYEAALRDLVLAPAGMARTTLADPRTADDATGMTVDADDRRVPAAVVDATFGYAAVGLRSTARDLFAFDRALAGRLLGETSRARMETPGQGGFGLGWEAWREGGRAITSHEGAIDGFSAFFARAPESGLAVCVLLSTDAFAGDRVSAATVGEAVLAMALTGRPAPPPVEAAATSLASSDDVAIALAGQWAFERETDGADAGTRERAAPTPPRLSIARDGKRMYLAPEGEPRVLLWRDAARPTTLLVKQHGVRIEARGVRLILERWGRELVYRRPER